jgi:hypothetical protein
VSENISNEVGSVKNVCLGFLLLLRTPVGLRSCAWLMIALASFYFFPFHVHLTGSAHSLHHFGVAQTSIRSLQTMMSSSNSPQLGETGRLFRDPITAAQDHVLKQAFPHGHHRSSVATVPADRRTRESRVKLSNHFAFVLQSLLDNLARLDIQHRNRLLSRM